MLTGITTWVKVLPSRITPGLLGPLNVNANGHPDFRLAHFGRAARDHEFSAAELQHYAARFLIREQRSLPNGSQERAGAHSGLLIEILRDNVLVLGEMAVDQA
ncbi:MAG: hypothetical protein AMS14_01860 [Planctomycetes bacterium DG_20]|nr:MAG: hypothetical protein AMS14_01860 [Planctomycetes bacterium DG_20]